VHKKKNFPSEYSQPGPAALLPYISETGSFTKREQIHQDRGNGIRERMKTFDQLWKMKSRWTKSSLPQGNRKPQDRRESVLWDREGGIRLTVKKWSQNLI
jgi:hypothetical protein